MVSKIYLIRHGITEGNEKRWYYGGADLPLTEGGKQTLRALAEKGVYPRLPEDADLYTTGLVRTEETCEILFGRREHRVIRNLREMEFGEYECCTYEELSQYPGFEKWAWDETGDVALPGGESKNQFAGRIKEGLAELIAYHRLRELSHRHNGKPSISAVVCHGGVISAVMQQLFPEEKGSMWDWMPSPGFGYVVIFENGDAAGYEKITEAKEEEAKNEETKNE